MQWLVFGDVESGEKEFYVAYMGEPTFPQFFKFMAASKRDEVTAMRTLARDCFLDGDKELISNDPAGAIAQYVRFEDQYKSEDGFEVVLVGLSNVATVKQTHSHYFGLNCINGPILEDLNASIVEFSNVMDIDVGVREILRTLERRRFWGTKVISRDTLKNHLCQGIWLESPTHGAWESQACGLPSGG